VSNALATTQLIEAIRDSGSDSKIKISPKSEARGTSEERV
jgi:GDP-D-mannose dehydratase